MAARWGAATVASRAVGRVAGTASLRSVLALSTRLSRRARCLQREGAQRRGPRAERSRRGRRSSDGRGTRVQAEDERRRVAVPARSRVGRRGTSGEREEERDADGRGGRAKRGERRLLRRTRAANCSHPPTDVSPEDERVEALKPATSREDEGRRKKVSTGSLDEQGQCAKGRGAHDFGDVHHDLHEGRGVTVRAKEGRDRGSGTQKRYLLRRRRARLAAAPSRPAPGHTLPPLEPVKE